MPKRLNVETIWEGQGVTILAASLDVPAFRLAELTTVLSSDELQQAARYSTADLRRRYVARHGILRERIALRLGVGPEFLSFVRGEHGKPRLVGGELQFSLSSRGDHCLLALSQRHEVGVDVEIVDGGFDYTPLLADHFSAAELVTGGEAFFRAWARKEACAKALGVGLGQGLSGFVVTSDKVAAGLTVHSLPLGPGLCGAIAIYK